MIEFAELEVEEVALEILLNLGYSTVRTSPQTAQHLKGTPILGNSHFGNCCYLWESVSGKSSRRAVFDQPS
jgi:hypothetical protein